MDRRTCILRPKYDCPYGVGDVVEWSCVAVAEDDGEDFDRHYAYAYIHCLSGEAISRQRCGRKEKNVPIIHKIMKKGVKLVVRSVITASSAIPLSAALAWCT